MLNIFSYYQRHFYYRAIITTLLLSTMASFKFQWTLVLYTFINISSSLISFRIMSAIGRAIKLNTHPQRHNPLIFCLNRNFISTCDKNTNGSFMTMKKKIKIDSRKYLNFTTPFKRKYKDNEVQYGKLLTFRLQDISHILILCRYLIQIQHTKFFNELVGNRIYYLRWINTMDLYAFNVKNVLRE